MPLTSYYNTCLPCAFDALLLTMLCCWCGYSLMLLLLLRLLLLAC
jgi:hypothetical protein